jgi:hypothetical protein
VENIPVNLDLCKSVKKSNFAWYPDNTGKPAITFNGNDVEWAFDSTSDRDCEFSRVAATRSNARVQAAAEGGRACNDLLGAAATTEKGNDK